ncbi:hypothetical protein [Glaciimonas immobilis]|uniref:Uncharacterized protein n=1 Tax=Glaciimonas immobilis TaxID=728004 RepID=A0A840RVD5_9BURK|nr:hypothetical protein [Glaciimonas immobilis]KAF3997661.1 hypothetical protein HAV38_13450 [Glaciimonas immobilis]MBB5200624.1 hypothetical protein [Glaciimonas immobilis]
MKQLHTTDGRATFTLPSNYLYNDSSEDMITFAFHYPGMQSIAPGKIHAEDQIRIYLRPLDSNNLPWITAPASLRDNALQHFDPDHPGRVYQTGQQGLYRTYQQGDPDIPRLLRTTYSFQAADGQTVTITDPAPIAAMYRAHRTIKDRFVVEYTIVKSVGRNFREIDDVVTSLINQHTTTRGVPKE